MLFLKNHQKIVKCHIKNLTNREPKIGQTVAGAELGDQMFVCLHEIFFFANSLKDTHSLNLCAGAIKVFITTRIYLGLPDTIGKENSIKETDTDFPARSK